MRFLKNKIARALELSKRNSSSEASPESPESPKAQSETSEIAFHLRSGCKGKPTQGILIKPLKKRGHLLVTTL